MLCSRALLDGRVKWALPFEGYYSTPLSYLTIQEDAMRVDLGDDTGNVLPRVNQGAPTNMCEVVAIAPLRSLWVSKELFVQAHSIVGMLHLKNVRWPRTRWSKTGMTISVSAGSGVAWCSVALLW